MNKQESKKYLEDNDLMKTFERRGVIENDIPSNDVLFTNENDFDTETPYSGTTHNLEEIAIEKFIEEVLPDLNSMEVLLLNKQSKNLVSLTTSKYSNAKNVFKWDNNFNWNYNSNESKESVIKSEVRSQGGGVDGYLRFSIMWANNNSDDSDLDAHCHVPGGGDHIYYSNKLCRKSQGELDIDIIHPQQHLTSGKKVVENITFPILHAMPDGDYRFRIHNYANRGNENCQAEIEFDGQVYNYTHDEKIPHKAKIDIATVTLKDGCEFSIRHHIPTDESNVKTLYGMKTNHFHRVNNVCLSPNYWQHNRSGDKHIFFMLEGARPETTIYGYDPNTLLDDVFIHGENIMEDTKVSTRPNELSGVGFNISERDEVIIRVDGNKILKLKF